MTKILHPQSTKGYAVSNSLMSCRFICSSSRDCQGLYCLFFDIDTKTWNSYYFNFTDFQNILLASVRNDFYMQNIENYWITKSVWLQRQISQNFFPIIISIPPFWIRWKFDQQIFIGHFSSNFYLTFQKVFIADVYCKSEEKSNSTKTNWNIFLKVKQDQGA